jgi:hypothetical protein
MITQGEEQNPLNLGRSFGDKESIEDSLVQALTKPFAGLIQQMQQNRIF